MRLLGICLLSMTLYGIGACTREDGIPNPPVRALIPCVVDAAPEDPLACPETEYPDAAGLDAATD